MRPGTDMRDNQAMVTHDIRACWLLLGAFYLISAAFCVMGAVCIGLGAYAILNNAPLSGGLCLLIAVWIARDFCDCAGSRSQIRQRLRELHELRRQFAAQGK
jgi:hypothetical protein